MKKHRVADVFEASFQEVANVEVRDGVAGDTTATGYLDDPMHSQESKRMRYRRLAKADGCRQVTHAHWPAKQRNENTDPVRLTEKGKDVSQIDDVRCCGQRCTCCCYSLSIDRFRQ